jgi:hypothetical protein
VGLPQKEQLNKDEKKGRLVTCSTANLKSIKIVLLRLLFMLFFFVGFLLLILLLYLDLHTRAFTVSGPVRSASLLVLDQVYHLNS